MFSELAKNDIKALREQGFSPTDEEIIALNDLAVQIEMGKDTTAANHPRFAFAGNVVFHEPTVGALEWWWEYGHGAAWTSMGQLRTHFFMLAHARDLDVLLPLKKPRDIRIAVKNWLKGVAATDDEMLRAMMYVKHGVNWILPDGKVEEPTPDDVLDRLSHLCSICESNFNIPLKELHTHTETQLMSLLKMSQKAGFQFKPSIVKQYMRYQQMVRNIEERGKEDGT